MRRSNWTPSIVPNGHDQSVYRILDDFGRLGRAWRETETERTDFESVVTDLMTGQYSDPVPVAAFRRWANDVWENIARENRSRVDLADEDLASSVVDFVDRHAGHELQL